MLKKECLCSNDKRAVLVVKENGRIYRLNNPSQCEIHHYRVDGCIETRSRKCDHMIYVVENRCIRLVELKGKNLKDAAEQIWDTLDYISTNIPRDHTVHGRVVLSRVQRPDIKATVVVRLQRRLAQLGGTFKHRVGQYEEPA